MGITETLAERLGKIDADDSYRLGSVPDFELN